MLVFNMDFLDSMPSVLSAFLVVVTSCALALLPYALARKMLLRRTDEHTKDLAGSVIFRISALHSLILALVFAQELLNYNEARNTITREAALVGDVYYDLQRYGESKTKSARNDLVEYTKIVLSREWETLAAGARLDDEAWRKWEAAYTKILQLSPETPREEALKGIMLERIREVSDLRNSRENAALSATHQLFLIAAIAGIVIISFAYFPFPPTGVNLTLLTIFGIYTGLVIYFIVAFANPFSGAGSIEPARFERLYEGMSKAA